MEADPHTVAEIARQIAARSATSATGRAQADGCADCGGTGWMHPAPGVAAVVRCRCWQARVSAERTRDAQEFSQFADANLEHLEAHGRAQRAALQQMLGAPGVGYFVYGEYGSGKTHLLVAQYRYLALRCELCFLRSSKQLVDELRRAETEEGYQSPILGALAGSRKFHLFWDDCDKAAARSGFRQEAIFELVDSIYRRRLALSTTSNEDLAELIEQGRLQSAVVRRLEDMCIQIRLAGIATRQELADSDE